MERPEKYTKYERARMLGSRALQISMGAPFLIVLSKEDLEKIKYDPLEIAKMEYELGVIPLTVRRPMPMAAEKEAKEEAAKEAKAA